MHKNEDPDDAPKNEDPDDAPKEDPNQKPEDQDEQAAENIDDEEHKPDDTGEAEENNDVPETPTRNLEESNENDEKEDKNEEDNQKDTEESPNEINGDKHITPDDDLKEVEIPDNPDKNENNEDTNEQVVENRELDANEQSGVNHEENEQSGEKKEENEGNQENENLPEKLTNNSGNTSSSNISPDTPHQTNHLDELIEHWIKEGDLLRLEHVVLAGQGDRLIERTSDDKQVQDFLDLVPIYMAKIRAVHEAVAKGQLREVRSILTRKRFALSRDHVGASPLHLAVLHGHTDVSTYIISHFPETMDGPDNEGRTPLHYATALHDNATLYKLLKAAGADENIEDKAGHSPKFYMNNTGSLTLAQLLEPYSLTE
ncbi:hypothetical protein JTE90_000962 [Oedothorax gibbosus]|uniref:Uncharacterized protein n=1 Tax=Oedothorax gibbosus TaxID=931172 RepID=A0AAV6TW99_9ARAC|nr:hypothetical protein JTE90_000962 [Oedothorax gibbosus]